MPYTTVGHWGDTGKTAYLYANGGQDFGWRAENIYDPNMSFNRVANSFNDPKLITLRHPEVATQGGAAMAMGAPILNILPGTYNAAAWGANKFGANLPYSPMLESDENTPGIARGFYYGMNAALAARGGVSLYRGVRGFFSLEGVTNLASPARTTHILAGDATGGGHAWFRSWQATKNGLLGRKSMFPITWSNRKIMNGISEVATNLNSRWLQQSGRAGTYFENSGQPALFKVQGVYANRRLTVIVRGAEIISAW
ncbi:MAG: EndoU domain-containing protein [Acidobacteria bacterium]|nr:EndoU domain-containing protein [Acidobacteriota bacterium]